MRNIIALKKAIKLLGGQSALAKVCGVSQPAIHNWLYRNLHVPVKHVLTIERACKKKVSRHELRPDIYPEEREINNNH